MRANHRHIALCAAVCALLLLFAGCGGGGSNSTTPPPPPTQNPTPTVSSVSPSPITNVRAGTPLTVTGTGFIASSTITFNGGTRPTTFVSNTQVQMTLTAADVATVGTVQIGVTNPAPGGGASTALAVPVQFAAPVVTAIAPNAATVGGADFTLTVTGSAFVSSSVVRWNGATRPTTFVSATQLKAQITAADIAAIGTDAVSVFTPTPGGGASSAMSFSVTASPVPVITRISPTNTFISTTDVALTVNGTGFVSESVIQFNGVDLPTTLLNTFTLFASIPAANLSTPAQFLVTVKNPATGGVSNGFTFSVLPNPVPVMTSISPASAASGATSQTVKVFGSAFAPTSVVRWNGSDRPTTFANAFELDVTLGATDLQAFGNSSISVFTPGPGGGTSASANFTVYLGLTTNDLIYNRFDGFLYASIPSSAGPTLGNSVVRIDPYTGTVSSPIAVGSEPNRMGLSDDGSTLWVSLDGANSVREVDLVNKVATANQIYFAGDPHVGLSPTSDVAVVPGSPHSVVVVNGGVIRVFDGTVQRPNIAGNQFTNAPGIAFGASPNTLYAFNGGLIVFTLDATGIANTQTFANLNTFSSGLRFDNGRLYLSSGAIVDATTGTLLGTFAAQGPVAPDSALGRAFILTGTTFSFNPDHIAAFRTDTFVPAGTVPVSGINSSFSPFSLIRWGQDGLAFRTQDSQVYLLRSTLVRDLSTTLADLAVTGTAPAAGTTGANLTSSVTVRNNGPNPATNVVLIDTPQAGAIFVSATPSQGTCAGTTVIRCNLGTIASGATATLQVVSVPTAAGSAVSKVQVSGVEGDNNTANNALTLSTAITGADFHAAPQIVGVSPNALQSGSTGVTLKVAGEGFGPSSTVRWNGADLPTTFVDGANLTATVDATLTQNLGWAAVDVQTPAPGGGTSAAKTVTIYSVVSLDSSGLLFDPFTRKLWASIPSTAPQVTGNSLLPIDPAAATLGTPINIGSEPTHIGLSDDGQFIYSVLAGSKEVIRFDVPTGTPGVRFSTVDPVFGPFTGHDVAAMPGNHDSVAVSAGSSVQVWDIAGATATRRGSAGFGIAGDFLGWGDNTHLFAYDSGVSPSKLHRYNVSATGLTTIDDVNVSGFAGHFTPSNGLLYSDSGGVVDPSPAAPNPPQLVGRFGAAGPSTVDAATKRTFILNGGSFLFLGNSPIHGIVAFDQATFDAVDNVDLSALLPNNFNNGFDLVRWGADGLAFRLAGDIFSSAPGVGKLVLLRGPAVTPQVAVTNAKPTATSVTPSSVAAGTGNTFFTVTGTGFVPGAVASWKGLERSTTFVNSTTLKVAIPVSDLTAAGSAAITVTNPNSVSSAAVTVTIN